MMDSTTNRRYLAYIVMLLVFFLGGTSLGTLGLFVAVTFCVELILTGLRIVDLRFEPSPQRRAFRMASTVALCFVLGGGIAFVGLFSARWEFFGAFFLSMGLFCVGLCAAAYMPDSLFGGSTPDEDAASVPERLPDPVNPYEFLMLPDWRFDPAVAERKRLADEDAMLIVRFNRWALVGFAVVYGLYFIHGRNPAYLTGLAFYKMIADGAAYGYLFVSRLLKNMRKPENAPGLNSNA
jgi:hypothetical protein